MTLASVRSVQEHIAKARNLVEALFRAVELYADHVAQLYKDEQGEYTLSRTLKTFVNDALCIASGLAELGLQEKGRVGILADNAPEWNLADVATAMNRGATVGFYTNDRPEDIAYKIQDAEVSVLFVDKQERLQKVLSIPKEQIPTLKTIVGWGEGAEGKGIVSFVELLQEKNGNVEERTERIQPDDLSKIVYTSGTSGPPKGAMLSHWNLLSNVFSALQCVILLPHDLLISYLPNAHIFQAFLDYAVWLNGGGLGYSHRKTLKEDLPKLRPHYLPGVPKVYKMLLQGIAQKIEELTKGQVSIYQESFDKEALAPMILSAAGLDRVHFFVSGAAKLDVEVAKILEEKLGIVVYEGYGLSETSPVISINTPEARKLGTVGKPIPEEEVKIVDEDRQPLGANQKGEIVVKGSNVFQGYLNKPEATAKVLKNGWFYTGDRGMIDEEGYLTVFGRAGHRVKFANGEYYDLEEIGACFLKEAKLVGQIAVAGEQQDYCVALLTLSEDLQVAQAVAKKLGLKWADPKELIYHEAIIEKVREEFRHIRDVIQAKNAYQNIHKAIYLRPFSAENREATPTQKIRLRFILDKYEREISALYRGEVDFVVLKVE